MTKSIETVAAALKLARSESKEAQALAEAIRFCQDPRYPLPACDSDRNPILRRFCSQLSDDLGECVNDVKGMICLWDDHPVLLYEKKGQRQAEAIRALLKVFEAGEWLAEYLLLRLPAFAKEPPTPMRMMWELTEKATEFQMHLETTERMLANWRKHIPMLKEERATAEAAESE